MAKFIPEYLNNVVDEIDVGAEEEADISRYYDISDESIREKIDLIRESLGRFDYTPGEIEEFVNNIDLDIRIDKIKYALKMFTRGERNINTECKYMFPVYRDPMRIEKKKELVGYLLEGGYVDPYIAGIIMEHINYEISLKEIRDAIYRYVRSKRDRKAEETFLIPIFRPSDTFLFPTEKEWKDAAVVTKIREAKPKVVLPKKPYRTMAEISKDAELRRAEEDELSTLKYPTRVKETEEEIVHVLSPTEAQADVYAKRLKGDDILCVFCEKVITHEEVMGFWFNIHPAHITCIHKQLNIKRSEKGLPVIDYEKLG
jgi:hypothetical protein